MSKRAPFNAVPIPDPDKILCVGLSYRDHAEETGMPAPRLTPSRIAGPRSC